MIFRIFDLHDNTGSIDCFVFPSDAEDVKCLAFKIVPESWTDSLTLRTLLHRNDGLKKWAEGKTIEVTRLDSPFKLVRVEETEGWDLDIQDEAGKVWGIYLLDTSVTVYQCSPTPTHPAYFIKNEFANPITEGHLVFDDGGQNETNFALHRVKVLEDNIPVSAYAETMKEAIKNLIHHYRANL